MTFAEAYQAWRPAFEDLLDPRYYTIGWLDWMMSEGRAILWHSTNSAAIAEIRCFPSGNRDAHVLCAAGKLDELKGAVLSQIISWAYDNRCISVTVESRAGWAKVLGEQGFEVHQVAVRKVL